MLFLFVIVVVIQERRPVTVETLTTVEILAMQHFMQAQSVWLLDNLRIRQLADWTTRGRRLPTMDIR